MGLVALALGYCAAIWLVLRGGWAGLQLQWPEPKFRLFGILAYATILLLFGLHNGGALIASFYLQEIGHVAALRSVGSDTRLRVLPIFADPPKWDLHKLRQDQEAFVALMGPAMFVPALIAAIALGPNIATVSPTGHNVLRVFSWVGSVYGIMLLLPFWPMPGGRIIRAVGETFWPLLPFVAGGMALAVVLTLAVGYQSLILGFIAFVGIRGLMALEHPTAHQVPMPRQTALWLLGAYLFATASLFSYGWPLIEAMITS